MSAKIREENLEANGEPAGETLDEEVTFSQEIVLPSIPI